MEVNDTSNLSLIKKTMNDELTDEELAENLNISNMVLIQQTILKLIEKGINDEKVHTKLLEYSKFIDTQFRVTGFCTIGHFAIYALKRLNFTEDFQTIYKKLSTDDKDIVIYIIKGFEHGS